MVKGSQKEKVMFGVVVRWPPILQLQRIWWHAKSRSETEEVHKIGGYVPCHIGSETSDMALPLAFVPSQNLAVFIR